MKVPFDQLPSSRRNVPPAAGSHVSLDVPA